MNKHLRHIVFVLFVFGAAATFSNAHAQTVADSTRRNADSLLKSEIKNDSTRFKPSPHKASLRSAVVPGWGQVYNRSYWKLPIIYGALGTTAYIFTYNLKTYKELKFAYSARYKASLPAYDSNSTYAGPYRDSADYFKLKPIYKNVQDANQIKYNRDEFRRNLDYTVLVFVAFWALNIIDASVDAHLKSFDVSPDLGLRFKAGYSDMARTAGVGVVLYVK